MKVYHVEIKEAYDELMIELEEKGCELPYGGKPTEVNLWFMYKETTCLIVDNYIIIHNSLDYYKEKYPNESIIEYKKGAEMEQEEMKHNLQEAKSSAKKLIEKIDEYLESRKPKFKVGDYVADERFDYMTRIKRISNGFIFGSKIYELDDSRFGGLDFGCPIESTRHATPEEIAEYESALSFHKHGRKPFELKRGDIVYLKGYDKNIFLDSGNIYKEHNFVNGDVILVKTVEEVNEWLENK